MALPPDVKLFNDPGQTRLILPIRRRTAPRVVAIIPIIFGLIFSGFAVFWMIGASGILEDRHAPVPAVEGPVGPEGPLVPPPPPAPAERAFEWGRMLFALFGIPFFVVGLIPIGLGVLGFFDSHVELFITADELIAVDHMGHARFRKRRPLAQIARFRVGPAFDRNQSETAGNPSHVIFVELSSKDDQPAPAPVKMVGGYPRPMLIDLAGFLVEELKRHGSAATLHADPAAAAQAVTLAVDPEPEVATGAPTFIAEPALPQPAGSKIQFVGEQDVLTFMVPRTGFRGVALFFLLFSLFWDGISYTFFGVMLVQMILAPSWENLGILGFLSIFVFIGTCTMLAAIQAAFRRAVVIASRDSLVFTQTGPIRKSEHQWTPDQLTAIRCGDSNTTVNGKRLQELQIYAGDKKRGLFEGRDPGELEWFASTLRAFYQVRA